MKHSWFIIGLTFFGLIFSFMFIGCDNGTTDIDTHTHSYSTNWSHNETQHWHECSCGDKKDIANHVVGAWIVDQVATETIDGSKHKECSICLYETETAIIPATGAGHIHSYELPWIFNATKHWKVCSCGVKSNEENHIGNPCTVCGYDSSTHTHSYSTTWSYNATQHWHECSCGDKKDVANHIGDPCTICGYVNQKLFANLNDFKNAISNSKGNFCVDFTIDYDDDFKTIGAFKVADKQSYFYYEDWDVNSFDSWFEQYIRINESGTSKVWLRNGTTEANIKTGDFTETTGSGINTFQQWDLYLVLTNGIFAQNGNMYIMNNAVGDFTNCTITILNNIVNVTAVKSTIFWVGTYTISFTQFGTTEFININEIAKKLTCTNISGISTSHIVVMLRTTDNLESGEWVAGGIGAITSTTGTIQLKNATTEGGFSNVDWTGEGEYFIFGWETNSSSSFSGVPLYVSKNKVNFISEYTNISMDDITTTMSMLFISGIQTARSGKAFQLGLFPQGTTLSTAISSTPIAGFTQANNENLSNDMVPLFYVGGYPWKNTGIFEVYISIDPNGTKPDIYYKQVNITSIQTSVAFDTFIKVY